MSNIRLQLVTMEDEVAEERRAEYLHGRMSPAHNALGIVVSILECSPVVAVWAYVIYLIGGLQSPDVFFLCTCAGGYLTGLLLANWDWLPRMIRQQRVEKIDFSE